MKGLRWDMFLIAGVLLLAALLWFVTSPGERGTWVVVTSDGQEIGRYALSEDIRITVGGEDYNVLRIADGTACISEANCGDHTCVRTGEISREGETIVCLPHKLVVTILGGESAGFDALTK